MKKLAVLFVIIIVIGVGSLLWWQNGLKSPDSSDTSQKNFKIQRGEAIRQVGNNLKEEGLIKDPVVFFLYVKQKGIDTGIQAGLYKLSPSMTLPEVVDSLQHGAIDVWVTVPEGFRAEEIAEALADSLSTYDESWVEVLSDNEGYLFPDTYLIPHDATIDQVVQIMRNNFNEKIESIGLMPTDPNLDKIVTIASLIEREALYHDDFPYVSSVIQNRLGIGMALQLDATVQYALGYDESGKKWWRNPTPDDLKLNSAYNTYKNVGLPPAPIANPGIDAIKAAANPLESDYIYYVNDSNGKLHFAKTLEEHNRNIEQYLN